MAPRRRTRATLPAESSARVSRSSSTASRIAKPSPKPQSATRSRTRRSRLAALDQSEAEEDILSEVEVAGSSPPPARRSKPLKEVIIPKMVGSKGSKASAEAPSVASDSTRENSIYDTPGTSIPTTPPLDGSSSRLHAGIGKGKAPARRFQPRTAKSKRKAAYIVPSDDEDDEDEDFKAYDRSREEADLKLAIALQEEEYSDSNKRRKVDDTAPVQKQPNGKTDGTRQRDPLDDSGDSVSIWSDSDSLSLVFSESEEEPEEADPGRPIRAVKRPSVRNMGKRERKLLKHHPELVTMWEDLAAISPIQQVQAPQPQSISLKMKSFQLEGLDWMIKQEQTQWKGGLLGDEMGMGKTIQAVALIMSDHPQKQPTLVLAPPVALMQWSREIGEYTNGKLKVFVYHGSNPKVKKITVKELKSYDVILISYNSLESLHRKETKGWGRGENIVKERSVVHAIEYHRCILDEAHSIKSRQTGSAKACFALNSKYKWCLSGTPVQNRIGEFFSLLRFLQVRPFAEYQCNNCTCASINWNMDGRHSCLDCGHSASSHISIFNQELLKLIQSASYYERSEGLARLHLITGRIMLRREKKNHVDSMELPPKEVVIHNEFFGEIERDFSSSIMSNTTRRFDTYVANGVMLRNYANIFGLIMQMRQVADHPDLILKKKSEEGGSAVMVCNICDEPAEDAIRSRCKHEFCRECVKSYIQACEGSGGDADCPRCHIALSIDFDQPEIEQDSDMVQSSSIINRIKMENWTSSTKIEMLIYDLYKLRSKKQTLKSIVFSQFTSMLQLIEWRLRRAGFNTVMLDGSMSPAQRQKSIDYFMNHANVEVFLVSLKAGGVALNLTEASRVFIVDPWWNPAAEWQSADRCHRIGQRRPCVITRLVIEDSVESRMVLLQEKKTRMIHGTINSDKVAMEKLTPEDMQFLFRGS